MLITTNFGTYRGQSSADVKITCPLCKRQSHVVFKGNKIVEKVGEYISSGSMMTQDLIPLETPIREFLRSGYCRECMEMFGETSNKIKYVRKERR